VTVICEDVSETMCRCIRRWGRRNGNQNTQAEREEGGGETAVKKLSATLGNNFERLLIVWPRGESRLYDMQEIIFGLL